MYMCFYNIRLKNNFIDCAQILLEIKTQAHNDTAFLDCYYNLQRFGLNTYTIQCNVGLCVPVNAWKVDVASIFGYLW